MQEFKGTKGEWSITEITESRIKINGNDIDVWFDLATSLRPRNEGIANAQLIVSAPELLKALQELTYLHQCEQEGLVSGQPTPQQWFEAVNRAELVMNKALNLEKYE